MNGDNLNNQRKHYKAAAEKLEADLSGVRSDLAKARSTIPGALIDGAPSEKISAELLALEKREEILVSAIVDVQKRLAEANGKIRESNEHEARAELKTRRAGLKKDLERVEQAFANLLANCEVYLAKEKALRDAVSSEFESKNLGLLGMDTRINLIAHLQHELAAIQKRAVFAAPGFLGTPESPDPLEQRRKEAEYRVNWVKSLLAAINARLKEDPYTYGLDLEALRDEREKDVKEAEKALANLAELK